MGKDEKKKKNWRTTKTSNEDMKRVWVFFFSLSSWCNITMSYKLRHTCLHRSSNINWSNMFHLASSKIFFFLFSSLLCLSLISSSFFFYIFKHSWRKKRWRQKKTLFFFLPLLSFVQKSFALFLVSFSISSFFFPGKLKINCHLLSHNIYIFDTYLYKY